MRVSYNKLWKLLVDKKMSKADLRKAVDIIAEDLGLDFPISSADYVAKIYKDFLVKHFDLYHQYYNQYYKILHENLQETDKK